MHHAKFTLLALCDNTCRETISPLGGGKLQHFWYKVKATDLWGQLSTELSTFLPFWINMFLYLQEIKRFNTQLKDDIQSSAAHVHTRGKLIFPHSSMKGCVKNPVCFSNEYKPYFYSLQDKMRVVSDFNAWFSVLQIYASRAKISMFRTKLFVHQVMVVSNCWWLVGEGG